MLIDIDKIKISDRIRQDMGNLKELADDIKKNGLINPPVVTPDYELIAGERRYWACKMLGWEQIEVRIINVEDYEHKLRMEISENENRKDFNFIERQEYMKKLINLKRASGANLHQAEEEAAKEVGIGSRRQYYKEKYIAENADEELIKQLDEKQISIHAAYQKLKAEKERLKKENEELKQSLDNTAEHLTEMQDERWKLAQELDKVKKEKEKLETMLDDFEPKVIEKEVIPEDYKKLKACIKSKDEHIKELTSKLASVVDAELKINTQRIEDRIRELITRQGELFEEIEFRIHEKDVDRNRIRELLFRLIDSINGIKERAEKIIESQERGQVIDVS